MNENWTLFIKKHKNIYLTKDAFEDLCKEFLDFHYTGKNILSNRELDKAEKKQLYVVFLAKWFTENLSNSRKSQIRKEFTKFIELKNKNNLKIYRWVVCLPHTLNDEEMKWWLNWREKQHKESGVNIDLLDGDFIIENTKRYDLFDKWFIDEDVKENTPENKEIETETDIEIFEITTIDKTEKKAVSEETTEKVIQSEAPEKEKITEQTQEAKEIPPIQKQNYDKKIEELPFKYEELKKQYLQIKTEHLNKLSNKEKKALQKLNANQNYFKLFDDENYKVEEDKDKRMFFNANAAKVHNNFDKALFLFEYIKRKKFYTEKLKNKKKQIYEEITELQKRVQSLIYEIEGDIFRVKAITEKDDEDAKPENITKYNEKAAEKYEKAYQIYSKDKAFNAKYLEFVGDLKLDNEEYAEAYKFFDKAIENKKTQELKNKKEYADKLKKAQKADKKPFFYIYTPIIAWWKYSKALKIFDKKLNKKQDRNYKKEHIKKVEAKYQKTFNESITIVSSLILILLVFITFKSNIIQASTASTKEKNISAMIKTADNIISNIATNNNYEKIHLIDTAIVLYSEVLKSIPDDTIIKKNLALAENIKKNYIATAQNNIEKNPSTYFKPMRQPSEGLQLFKYTYDPNNPSKGKYGYVNQNRKIIIPPVYDFNPNKMYDGKENFHDGKAVVMLKTSDDKETYFLIDKNNNVIKKLVNF